MSRAKAWRRTIMVAAVVVALDQALKAIVAGSIYAGERVNVFFGIDLTYLQNRGIAFGLFPGSGSVVMPATLVALSVLIAYFWFRYQRPGAWLAVGLLIGGALGNLVDRLRLGGVVDFVDTGLWPAFNLADVAIVAGVLALVWVIEGPEPSEERSISQRGRRASSNEDLDSQENRSIPSTRGRAEGLTDSAEPPEEGHRVEVVVHSDYAGTRLDVFLATLARISSRSHAQRLIEAGLVTVDGKPVRKRHIVSNGERVTMKPQPPPVRQPSDLRFGIKYEDQYLMVIDKPAGMVVHPAPGHDGDTLVDALAEHFGPWPGGEDLSWQEGLVHRIDKETSGLIAVAKERSIMQALQSLVRSRAMKREYVALVAGHLESRRGTIDAPLGRDVQKRTKVTVRTDKPRPARTHFEVTGWLKDATLVRVHLETGRTHQIRAHFAAIGHPVVGDSRYGTARYAGLERQFLHAGRLAFTHPATGKRVDVESLLPADLQRALESAQPARESGDRSNRGS